jgi:nucleoside-diphosphate-sugar epimerase
VEGLVSRDAAPFREQRVLITGGAGFIGRRLAIALAQSGAEVSIVDTEAPDITTLPGGISDIHFLNVDIRDEAAVRGAFINRQPEYVFHLAAAGVTQPFLPLEAALAVNLHGAINVFRASFDSRSLGQERVIRLVHTGTPYERGGAGQEIGPINPYAASKAAAFAVARMFHRTEGWPIVTVRPFQAYGPGQPEPALIPSAIAAARADTTFHMTGGEQRRDFIYVDDLVRGYLLAALKGNDGQSYDLGWGESHSIKCVIRQLFTLLKARREPHFGALPYRPGEVWDLRADIDQTTRDLEWSPQVTLKQGLALTIKNFTLDKPNRKL